MSILADQRQEDAWAGVEERYRVGQEARGIVTRLAPFGVFVQLEPGIEGILYTFELGPGTGALARFAPGEEVRVYIKDIDPRKRRLELGLEAPSMPVPLAERELPPAARRETLPDEWLNPASPAQPLFSQLTSQRNERLCPSCQRPAQESWNYCVYCGETLQRRCPTCGTIQPDLPGARYCCECGRRLG